MAISALSLGYVSVRNPLAFQQRMLAARFPTSEFTMTELFRPGQGRRATRELCTVGGKAAELSHGLLTSPSINGSQALYVAQERVRVRVGDVHYLFCAWVTDTNRAARRNDWMKCAPGRCNGARLPDMMGLAFL